VSAETQLQQDIHLVAFMVGQDVEEKLRELGLSQEIVSDAGAKAEHEVERIIQRSIRDHSD
jgi:hypothetical protein